MVSKRTIATRPNQKLLDRFAGENTLAKFKGVSDQFELLAHLINDTCPNTTVKIDGLRKLLLSRDTTLQAYHQQHELVHSSQMG